MVHGMEPMVHNNGRVGGGLCMVHGLEPVVRGGVLCMVMGWNPWALTWPGRIPYVFHIWLYKL